MRRDRRPLQNTQSPNANQNIAINLIASQNEKKKKITNAVDCCCCRRRCHRMRANARNMCAHLSVRLLARSSRLLPQPPPSPLAIATSFKSDKFYLLYFINIIVIINLYSISLFKVFSLKVFCARTLHRPAKNWFRIRWMAALWPTLVQLLNENHTKISHEHKAMKCDGSHTRMR